MEGAALTGVLADFLAVSADCLHFLDILARQKPTPPLKYILGSPLHCVLWSTDTSTYTTVKKFLLRMYFSFHHVQIEEEYKSKQKSMEGSPYSHHTQPPSQQIEVADNVSLSNRKPR